MYNLEIRSAIITWRPPHGITMICGWDQHFQTGFFFFPLIWKFFTRCGGSCTQSLRACGFLGIAIKTMLLMICRFQLAQPCKDGWSLIYVSQLFCPLDSKVLTDFEANEEVRVCHITQASPYTCCFHSQLQRGSTVSYVMSQDMLRKALEASCQDAGVAVDYEDELQRALEDSWWCFTHFCCDWYWLVLIGLQSSALKPHNSWLPGHPGHPGPRVLCQLVTGICPGSWAFAQLRELRWGPRTSPPSAYANRCEQPLKLRQRMTQKVMSQLKVMMMMMSPEPLVKTPVESGRNCTELLPPPISDWKSVMQHGTILCTLDKADRL